MRHSTDFNRFKQDREDALEDSNCSILHHKVIVIDARTVITDSYNFTTSAEQDNICWPYNSPQASSKASAIRPCVASTSKKSLRFWLTNTATRIGPLAL